ncbi:MAG: hypothetical protein K0S63_1014, partial [Gammaproteobacteria bacterium]|nr:hypothetical protein [Gammaproteobacteria bacterium]
LSILQQWWVMKRVEKMETEHKGHHKKF